ncbi:MAG: hydantoinase/oxoprolinase family protein [Candidatus Promineifilaceae bacterium]|nr:hydantoinase/oxoprolinase family protein [Candidatus Promineifilaceae bacterium]
MSGTERVGVDTGGTFTDLVWLDGEGGLQAWKLLSTPDDPGRAVLDGLERAPTVTTVVHGSTVATNALLERRGARTALVTTSGFADVLAIGRQNRPDLYALVPVKPPPLVPRQWRFEVAERISAVGEVNVLLAVESLTPLLESLAAERIESVAVCLLFSFLYPEHERLIGRAIQSHWEQQVGPESDIHISLSSEILPEFREYERTSTTVINAYVAPLMARYLSRLERALAPRLLTVMQSNGGVIKAGTAGRQAARTVLSGPAGGVVGAQYVAEPAGFRQIITFDMGGTSTDVALCPDRLPLTSEGEIGDMPLRLPMIDIHTVGAGGGSLARLDPGGALHVGPQSAGADPGPACYGRQAPTALQATVTDANLVLNRLHRDHFLGGALPLDEAAARTAVAQLADSLGSGSVEEAAWDVIQVANANMERAIRRISVERGHDPRDFTLVAFGGAGPLHACELAASMQIPRVFVPTLPGVLSALGMLAAAPTRDYSQTVMAPLAANQDALDARLHDVLSGLEQRAAADMVEQGYNADELLIQSSLDIRYVGQSFELTVPFSRSDGPAAVLEAFHQAHQQRYGYARRQAAVEVVHARVAVEAPISPPPLPRAALGPADASEVRLGEAEVWFAGGPQRTSLYQRETLRPGNILPGPAVIFQYDTTTVVPPRWQASVDELSNLLVQRD